MQSFVSDDPANIDFKSSLKSSYKNSFQTQQPSEVELTKRSTLLSPKYAYNSDVLS